MRPKENFLKFFCCTGSAYKISEVLALKKPIKLTFKS